MVAEVLELETPPAAINVNTLFVDQDKGVETVMLPASEEPAIPVLTVTLLVASAPVMLLAKIVLVWVGV
jgi:hypothetical protein